MTDNPFALDYVPPATQPADTFRDDFHLGDAKPLEAESHIRLYPDIEQGSLAWLSARCGLLTASEMKNLITPTLKIAINEKEKASFYELLSQRITGYVPEQFQSWDMMRGHEDEMLARISYAKEYAPVEEMGFITNNKWGFKIGYSPDGLVGYDGLIEAKSRLPKYQIQTMVEHVEARTIPAEYAIQVQTGLLVSERKWCDFISYSGGLPMVTIRVFPDPEIQAAILTAANAFEARMAEKIAAYERIIASDARLIPTERRIEKEMQ